MRAHLVLGGGNKNEDLVVGVVHDSNLSVVFDSEIKQTKFHLPSHSMS